MFVFFSLVGERCALFLVCEFFFCKKILRRHFFSPFRLKVKERDHFSKEGMKDPKIGSLSQFGLGFFKTWELLDNEEQVMDFILNAHFVFVF